MSTRPNQHLVSVLTPGQKAVYLSLVGVWMLSLAYFWTWWLQEDHIVSFIGMFLTSILLLWLTVLPGYALFFAAKAKRPNPNFYLKPGEKARYVKGNATPTEKASVKYPLVQQILNIAFCSVVAHAPSEDAYVAMKTLGALVKIRDRYFPKMDIYLASEDCGRKLGQEDLLADFCQKNRIIISCRAGLNAYNRDAFPRRKRCKEGNLSYFYDAFVLSNPRNRYVYSFQFDVDHVPTPGYFAAMLHGFADPQVGLVTAPSICNANKGESMWTLPRAVLEAMLHGVVQAGFFAPVAIGSHYAVRIEALRTWEHPVASNFWNVLRRSFTHVKGGIGPELGEDATTTEVAIGNGWKTVHCIDAIAYGDGPNSFMAGVVQEQQWARTQVSIGLKWFPGYASLGHMPLRIKLQFAFMHLWYPLLSLQMIAGILIPLLALWGRFSWVDMNYGSFMLHSGVVFVASLLPIFWIKHLKLLRPIDVPLMSIGTILFELVRWPWVLLGVIEGFIGTVFLNRELSFKVTPKGVADAQPLTFKSVAPYVFISALCFGTALACEVRGGVRGYYYFAFLTGMIYLFATVVIIAIHVRENRSREGFTGWLVWKPILLMVLVSLLSVTSLGVRGPVALAAITGQRIIQPTETLVDPQSVEYPQESVGSALVVTPASNP
jgi:cellulose synthase (UDP-forming)